MNSYKFTKEQAREFLKQEALNEIDYSSDFSKFLGPIFCVVAKYGLQLEAKEEGFFNFLLRMIDAIDKTPSRRNTL